MSASTRQRLLQFQTCFKKLGIEMDVAPLFSNESLRRLYEKGDRSIKSDVYSYIKRCSIIRREKGCDFFWINAELFPYLPGYFEKFAINKSNCKIIIDFDDATFHRYDNHRSWFVRRILGSKLEALLGRASLVVCGNAYIEQYAARFCPKTEVVPTVVDTSIHVPSYLPSMESKLTVGWIGSPSTWTYLEPMVPILQTIAEEMDLRVRIVGAGPQRSLGGRFEFLDWAEEKEVALIQGMDIGIMPLPNDMWARGKCGYKLIQYMACGRPVIASPVGVNSEIIDDGVNGFLATDARSWIGSIRRLAADLRLRASMGEAGRRLSNPAIH